MKRMTQKMLSLLLAMAMVCTMLPAAMAKSNDDDYDIDLEVSDVETFDFYEEDDNGDSVYDGIDDAIDDYLSDDEYDYVGLSMMCYTLWKANKTCFGERQAKGRMGKLLYARSRTASWVLKSSKL